MGDNIAVYKKLPGGGSITIDTTYCVKTQEEIDEILEDIKQIYIYYAIEDAKERRRQEQGG